MEDILEENTLASKLLSRIMLRTSETKMVSALTCSKKRNGQRDIELLCPGTCIKFCASDGNISWICSTDVASRKVRK